jgi:16S rRNA (guanine527-N7)-methyltransferase
MSRELYRAELARYVAMLRESPYALVSRGDMARLDDHIDDSLVARQLISELAARTLVDVGTGGGFPGIPLAITVPQLEVHLVESLARKCEFLRSAVHSLHCEARVFVHQVRAEAAPAEIGRESMDVGVCRAVALPSVAVEYLAPLVRSGGAIVLWTTGARLAEGLPTERAVRALGISPSPRVISAPSALRADGILAVWERFGSVDPIVPRREGLAARKPL